MLADLDAFIYQRKNSKKKLTTSGFLGKMRRDAPSRFFTNAGYSPDEFAEEVDLDVEDVLDLNNWINGELVVGDRHFRFNWTYTGEFYEEY